MKILCYNSDFTKRIQIAEVISFQTIDCYNQIGKFQLIIGDTAQNINFLENDNIIYNYDTKQGYIIKECDYDTANHTITASGYSILEILNKRIIMEKTSIYNIESSVYTLVNNNLRGLSNITTAPVKGLTETFKTSRSNGQLADEVCDLCQKVELGCRMNFDVKTFNYQLEVYKGRDMSYTGTNPAAIVFDSDSSTLAQLKITNDISAFKNVAIVRGAGKGEARTVVVVGTATGDSRYELDIDARQEQPEEDETQAEYEERLKELGEEKLAEAIQVLNFELEIVASEYGKRYKLGDLVTCNSSKYNLRFNARITQAQITWDSSGISTKLTLGEPTLTLLEVIKKWQK